jgi:hypothetical protein
MIDFIVNNSAEIFGVIAAVHVIALFVVNLTPTPVDNLVVEKVYRVIELIGGVVTSKAKEPTPAQTVNSVTLVEKVADAASSAAQRVNTAAVIAGAAATTIAKTVLPARK